MGRPPGALNKRTREIMQAIEEDGMTPLEYLVRNYQDEDMPPPVRIDCAKAALPYCHARLSSVDVDSRSVDERPVEELSDEELTRLIREVGEKIEVQEMIAAEERVRQLEAEETARKA